MINSQELIFMVDENNNPVSPLAREIAHGQGLWHRSCDIWVVNSKGEILCQRRSMKKDVKPGLWESYFGGHVLAGEDYLDSAVKETY
ncbi:MAG: NUDIX domain-containing protein, partial [Candidatus Curtissbacteria bacterium]